jgi:hypothetical protein
MALISLFQKKRDGKISTFVDISFIPIKLCANKCRRKLDKAKFDAWEGSKLLFL